MAGGHRGHRLDLHDGAQAAPGGTGRAGGAHRAVRTGRRPDCPGERRLGHHQAGGTGIPHAGHLRRGSKSARNSGLWNGNLRTAPWARPVLGDSVGANPTDRAKAASKRSILVDGAGGPLSAGVAGANVHDTKLLALTLESILVDPPADAIENPGLDKGCGNPTGHLSEIPGPPHPVGGFPYYPAKKSKMLLSLEVSPLYTSV